MASAESLALHRAGNRLMDILAHRRQRRDGQSWLIVYLDVITLLLAMFILLVNEPQDLQSPEESRVASQSVTQKTPVPSEIIQESTAPAPAAVKLEDNSTKQAGLAETEQPAKPQIQMPELILPEKIQQLLTEASNLKQMESALQRQLQQQPESQFEPKPIDQLESQAVEQNQPASKPGELPVNQQVSDEQGPSQIMIDQLKALDAEQMRIEISTGQVNLHLPEAILFATGQSDLLSDATALLEQIAPILQQNNFPVSVEGHTDNVPISSAQFPSNWELSSARAAVVIRKLVEAGIDFKRLKAIGYADTQPIADNQTEAGRRQNRRVNIIIHATTE